LKAIHAQALTGGFAACNWWQSHLACVPRQSLGTSQLVGVSWRCSFPGSTWECMPGGSATSYYAQIVELVSA